MLRALSKGVDGGMPLYYLLAHGWLRTFGYTLLSLRLCSSVLIGFGVLAIWRYLRRTHSSAAVAIGLSATFLGSSLLLNQNAEVRFYGLFFLCASLVMVLHSRLCEGAESRLLVLGGVLANAALLFSHVFGVLYSAAGIAALALWDYRRRQARPRLYLTLLSSWLLLGLWFKPLLRISDIAKPHNWIPRPDFMVTLKFLASLSAGFWIGAGVCLIVTLITEPSLGGSEETVCGGQLYQAAAYLAVPAGVCLISLMGAPSLFLDRYFLPSSLGLAVVLVFLLERTLGRIAMKGARLAVITLALAVTFSWPVYHSLSAPRSITFDWLNHSLAGAPPVIVEDANTFLPLVYYSPHNPSYYYPLDWESALHSQSLHATVQSKLMRNAKDAGYHQSQILDEWQARCGLDTFVVLDSPGIAWFEDRIQSNSAFEAQKLGDLGFGDPGPAHVWMVRRLYRSPDCIHR